MAQNATIFKAELQVTDMDRNYYEGHVLTIARHPSETDERMMLRILAYALYASEDLTFCKGLSSDEEPDLWRKDLIGDIKLWIELGQPDEKRIRKACNKAHQVVIITYDERSADVWWQKNENKLNTYNNLTVLHIVDAESEQLTAMSERTMRLQATIQDGEIWMTSGDLSANISPVQRKQAST